MGEKRVKMSRVRKLTSEGLRYSVNTFPQLPLAYKVNMTELLALKSEWKAQGNNVSINAFLVKAMSIALTKHPEMNTRAEDDYIIYYDTVNIGVAVNTTKGLMVPVIKDAQDKSLMELTAEIKSLKDRIENRQVTLDDFQGGTATLSSVSNPYVQYGSSILTNNECLMLGVMGTRKDVVVDENENIVVADVMPMCVNYSHWIVDGVPAHAFSNTLYDILTHPRQYFTSAV